MSIFPLSFKTWLAFCVWDYCDEMTTKYIRNNDCLLVSIVGLRSLSPSVHTFLGHFAELDALSEKTWLTFWLNLLRNTCANNDCLCALLHCSCLSWTFAAELDALNLFFCRVKNSYSRCSLSLLGSYVCLLPWLLHTILQSWIIFS